MLAQLELWGFLAGLGLFLLGMYMLEQGLRGLGSRSMKKFLREQTRSPFRGVITGTLVTAFLQSSSLVGLIVLAFVGAGIFELRNALGIILGSNLGTTFTGWIVTLIGFKLDLGNFAQPMLALGALGTVFLRQESKPYFSCNLVLGLGLLLMGLDQMTTAFNALADSMDVSIFQGHNMFYYFLAGMFLTAVIQSSSVSMMILLSAMYTGVITLDEAAPFAIGADLGTTSTVLLGAMKGSSEKRRVAFSHFFFNLITDLLALLLLPVLLYVITDIIGMKDPLFSLVAFHSLFNLVGILVFLVFLEHFVRFLYWLVSDDEGDICSYIQHVPANVPDAAIVAIRQELVALIMDAMKLNMHCFRVKAESISRDIRFHETRHSIYEDRYGDLKRKGGELLGYTYSVQVQTKDEEDVRILTQLNHAIRNVSYATKFIKDIRHNLVDFRHSTSDAIDQGSTELRQQVKIIYSRLASLALDEQPELAQEHFQELGTLLRSGYEKIQQDIYHASGVDQIDDDDTSSLLNANRALYLSNKALMEAVHVLLPVPTHREDESPIVS